MDEEDLKKERIIQELHLMLVYTDLGFIDKITFPWSYPRLFKKLIKELK
jgi:hypothetical protein